MQSQFYLPAIMSFFNIGRNTLRRTKILKGTSLIDSYGRFFTMHISLTDTISSY